jgi:hypothetical protein
MSGMMFTGNKNCFETKSFPVLVKGYMLTINELMGIFLCIDRDVPKGGCLGLGGHIVSGFDCVEERTRIIN